MKLDVYKIDGSKSGDSVELSEEIFGIEPNDHVIYLAVKAYLANQRQGTHKSKERNEVRGGGRKPWRQKGRGVARAGTIRSPLWVGGGRIFGPKPRNYREKLNKKVKDLARKSALTYKAKSEQIVVVEDFNFELPKSKELYSILNALNVVGKKTLILTNGADDNVYKASTYEILNSKVLLVQKSAVEKLVSTLN